MSNATLTTISTTVANNVSQNNVSVITTTSTAATTTMTGTISSTLTTVRNESVSTTLTTNLSTILTTIISSSMTNPTPTINGTTSYTRCLLKNTRAACGFAEFIYILAYFFLALSFLPQIIHLFHHGSKYISGISYSWILLRVLGFASLIIAHSFDWYTVFEVIGMICSIVVFGQILIYADNLHRPQRIILIVIAVVSCFSGMGIILLLKKYPSFLSKMGWSILAGHVLPQILLNSLLRTAKAISPLATMILSMSSALFFAAFYTFQEDLIYLVVSYYAFTFFIFVYLQSIAYTDENIHVISRSSHTVLTPGVDIFTGLDANGARASGQDPQMFSIDDLENPDGTDVVYQPVTSNKLAQSAMDQNPVKRFIWYGTLGTIFAIETALTIMLIHRAWTSFIILVPLSIASILGLFYVLRMKLSDLQSEALRKIL